MDAKHNESLKEKRVNFFVLPIGIIASLIFVVLAVQLSIFTDNGKSEIGVAVMGVIAAAAGVIFALSWASLITFRKRGKVFISYSSKDETEVKKLKEELFQRGYTYVDPFTDVLVGEDFYTKLVELMSHSDAVIVVLSKAYAQSRWTNLELTHAISGGRQIFPVRLEPDAEIPKPLQDIKYLDLRKDKFSDLIRALDRVRSDRLKSAFREKISSAQ